MTSFFADFPRTILVGRHALRDSIPIRTVVLRQADSFSAIRMTHVLRLYGKGTLPVGMAQNLLECGTLILVTRM